MIAPLRPRGAGTWHDPGVSALGIHHVGIAVRDLERGARALRAALRRRASRRASASRTRAWTRSRCCSARAAAWSCSRRSRDDTPVGRFLARRGEGMHHLAFARRRPARPSSRSLRAAGRDPDRRAAARGHLRARGIRAPRVARRRAERAGAGDDVDGGVMSDTSVKFEIGFRGGGTRRGRGERRGLGSRRGRARGRARARSRSSTTSAASGCARTTSPTSCASCSARRGAGFSA